MPPVIGIPRGLFYYKYYPLWKTYFEEIGCELAVSPETCRRIMESGISTCVGEACLPVKAWFGHAAELAGRCDMLFAPRYTSVAKYEYICPKFGGLPDMARAGLPGLPELLSPEVNRHTRADGGLAAAVEAGRTLGIPRRRAARAYESAVRAYIAHRAGLIDQSCVAPQAPGSGKPRILLLGHAYTTGDRYLNMEAARKLAALGAVTVTPDCFDPRDLRAAAVGLEKPMFWTYATQALGLAHILGDRPSLVDGVLALTCFGCGVDSFALFLFERRVRRAGIPYAVISLDEHTGEAGLMTRLEAFSDTLGYRRAGA
jgi:predicted nucleotide-binding protein (sugar kinase/HSP70/actin superfamily)